MKLKIFVLIGISLTILLFAGCSRPNEDKDFIFDGEIGKIIDYVGARKDVIIPNKIYGEEVKIIGEDAFKDKGIESISFPSTLTQIEARAFSNNKLKKVIIPNSVENVGSSAFSNNEIKELSISIIMGEIKAKVFENNNIEEVVIPTRVLYIGVFAFSGNENIKKVTIKGDNPERFNSGWTNIGFPESLKP